MIETIRQIIEYNFSMGNAIVLICFFVFLFILLHKVRKTERLAVEASLKEQTLLADNELSDNINRTKIEFFQNMSHDFKTPLTVISTSLYNITDMIDYGDMNKDEIKESIDNAQREIMRLARIVDGAMKLSSSNSSQYDMEPIDMAILLREVAQTYLILLERRNNTLTINTPQKLPYTYGNADMLAHVMVNLLSNANRYTNGGKISINAETKDNMIFVTTTDNGSGVKPELLPHVFERGITDGGTGLGLSICKRTIEEVHKGKIFIKSQQGHGTKVIFSLPCYVENEEDVNA